MKSLKAKFRKTDVNEWNKNDERLLAAVEHGETDKVTSLLAKKGASAVKLDGDGKSALHAAAARGQTDCLSVILSHGADLSITDAAGSTPLHLAAKNNHLDCTKKLLQSKCPVDAVDGSGKTALHLAAANGSVQLVQLLCEAKSPVNLKDADGLTPLLLASKLSHPDVCSVLLDGGADVNAADNNGRTAVMVAAESNAVAVVDVLARRGADLWAVDSQGHDVVHFAKLSGNTDVLTALSSALSRQHVPDSKSPKSPQHDQVAKLSDDRVTTPKKRKAPPPPISPLQSSGPSSPSVVASVGTPASSQSETPRSHFNYKEDDFRGATLKEEVEKLHEERNMLLETIEDLKQTVTFPELDAKVEQGGFTASAALVSALQAKITALTLDNQQLHNELKKHPAVQGSEELKESSRPDSMASNSSFHSTQDDFTSLPVSDGAGGEGGGGGGGGREEIRLLRQALDSVQSKLLESRKENRSLQAQLRPEEAREEAQGKGREEELMESLAELQAKLTDTQERYHQALEEVEELRVRVGGAEGAGGGGESSAAVEREVKQLEAQLVQSGAELVEATHRIRQLEEALRRAEEERQRSARVEELYKEAQEEIRMLQEALRGTVPVEAAAKDFEEMKAELNEVIAGLQRRLLELSHSYSDTKSQLSSAHKQLAEARAETNNNNTSSTSSSSSSSSSSSEQQVKALSSRVEELQAALTEAEEKRSAAQEEVAALRREAELQAQGSVSLGDHTQVMSSLGNAIKELEAQLETVTEELQQRRLQVEELQNRLGSEKVVAPDDDSVSRHEHQCVRERLEGEVSRVTQLLQDALRKQDDMALEAADAWQQARESRGEREALQELLMSREQENQSLSVRLEEAQDAVEQLKVLVEKHVASEREKNKRIDDLSREVLKLKEALNSLSQLSYSSGSPAKRHQQNQQHQQLETLQQQVKQLQYQLADSKKQHNEVVSVYRMHLLYAVQGQMDEDVQKALKQILMMCKMPSQAKEAC